MSFGEQLSSVRRRSGLTQEQFAEQLQVSRQAVSKWESGRGYPEMEKILYICNRYQVSIADMFAEEAPPPAQPAVPDTPPETPQQPLPRETLHNAFSAFLTNLSPKNKWLAAGVLLGIGALSGLIGLCLKGGSTDMSTAIWIAAIIIFGVVEAVTAGLTSIWFVLGSMAGLVAAVCNGPIWLQVTLFFVVSIVALAATRPLVTKLMKKDIKPTNADRVLGGSVRVTERIDNDVPTGAVYIDGKTWSARSSTGEIIELRPSRLPLLRIEAEAGQGDAVGDKCIASGSQVPLGKQEACRIPGAGPERRGIAPQMLPPHAVEQHLRPAQRAFPQGGVMAVGDADRHTGLHRQLGVI